MKRLLAALAAAILTQPAYAGIATDWARAYESRARLVAGKAAGAPEGSYVAGVEIEMPKGWKTYWRSPGESGVPPEFDWSASANLASAETLYPAPRSHVDQGGVTIGYQDRVVFPIEVRAADPSKPVTLKGVARYGVCKDICIPAEVALAIELAPAAGDAPPELAAAIEATPRMPNEARPGDPVLLDSRVEVDKGERRLVFRVRFPGGLEGAEAFLEGPGGAYLPLPKRIAEDGEEATFSAGVGAAEVLSPVGRNAVVTLVGPKGQSTAAIPLGAPAKPVGDTAAPR